MSGRAILNPTIGSLAAMDELVPFASTEPAYNDWTTASKRLNGDQQAAIYTKRTQIVKDFVP